MSTLPDPGPRCSDLRTAMRLALIGGVAWPLVLTARSAPWHSSLGAALASSALPVLLLLAALGHAAEVLTDPSSDPDAETGATSPRSRAVRGAVMVLGAIVTLLALSALWSWATASDWPDPTGLGVFADHGAAAGVCVVVALLALALGWALRRISTAVETQLRRPPWWAVTAVVIASSMVLTTTVGSHPTAAVLVSLLITALVAVTARALGPAPITRIPLTAVGAATGLFAFTAASLDLMARQTPERSYVEGGVLRVVGPLAPLAIWTGLLSAALGIMLCVAVADVAMLSRGRLRGAALQASYRHHVGALVAAGFVLRVLALVTFNDARRDSADPYFYHVTANLLARGRGFWEPLTWVHQGHELASALHGPAFPAALSLWSRLGGTGYFDHQMASVVLGVPPVLAVVVLARLLFGRRAALIAGTLAVVYPNMWVTDGALFVEGLMAVFTTVATWCAYRYRAAPSRKWVVWMGVLIALAALTRGEAVLLVVLLMVPIVLRTPRLSWPQRWKHTAIGLAAFVATLAPWMIYNAPRFNVFVPLSTNSNEVLFYANCDDAYYGSFIGFWSFACQERYRAEFGNPPGDQAEQSVFWRSRAIEYMKAHSDRLPRVIVARVARQWELFRPWQTADFAFIEGRPATAVQIGQDMFYVMMLLAVPGSFALRRRRTPSWPLWSHAVAVTLTAAYAYGTLRFRAPFEPILCVLAAIGGVALFDAARARVHARRQGGTPAVAH